MPNINKSRYQGTASTLGNAAATRKLVIPLPFDGAWSISGQVLAIDPTPGRGVTHQVVFNIAASGISVGGTATETDGVNPGWVTQPSSNPLTASAVTAVLNAGVVGPPQVPPTLELEFTGSTLGGGGGTPLTWGWILDITVLTP